MTKSREQQILDQLDTARQLRLEAARARRDARRLLESWVPIALREGVGVSEIAGRTGLSRQAIYDLKRSEEEGDRRWR